MLGRSKQAGQTYRITVVSVCLLTLGSVPIEPSHHIVPVDGCGSELFLFAFLDTTVKTLEQFLQAEIDVAAKLLVMALECETGHVLPRCKYLAVCELVSLATVAAPDIDTPCSTAISDEFTRPMPIAKVLDGGVQVLQVLREDLLDRSFILVACGIKHNARSDHVA